MNFHQWHPPNYCSPLTPNGQVKLGCSRVGKGSRLLWRRPSKKQQSRRRRRRSDCGNQVPILKSGPLLMRQTNGNYGERRCRSRWTLFWKLVEGFCPITSTSMYWSLQIMHENIWVGNGDNWFSSFHIKLMVFI